MRLRVEYEYTIIRINTQHNIFVIQVFANPVSVFILLELRSLDNITVCILVLSFCLCYLNEVIGELPSCFMNLLLKSFFVQSHKTFHVEKPRRNQQMVTSRDFSVLHVNTRSMNAHNSSMKLNGSNVLAGEYNFDVICLTETWLDNSIDANSIRLIG